MSLAKQQWLFLAIALALLTALAAGLVQTQRRVARAMDELSQAQTLAKTVVLMRNVAVEAAIHRTDRQEIQWQGGMRQFTRTLQALSSPLAEEASLVQNIKSDVDDADQLFHRLAASVGSPQARSVVSEEASLIHGQTATALHLNLSDVVLMALRLSQMKAADVRAARQNVLTISTLLIVFMLLVLVAYHLVFRKSVLAPINQLQSAIQRIASGSLEHRVGLISRNEFGALGRQFDHMTEELQAARTRLVRRTEELEDANRNLDAFASSVSHDLRAPLRGIDGFATILEREHASTLNDDARHCVEMIHADALRMGRLIDDLLAFARLARGPLVKERVRIEALVQAALKELLPEQQGRRIDITIAELPEADVDPRLLTQVLLNLVSNALKFTRGRDPAVIRVGCEKEGDVPVYFVQDNGVGFDMKYAEKLFGVFERLHRQEDFEGTGVGLAIVQRIIAYHGGRVWAQAGRNEGATFFFTLQEPAHGSPSGSEVGLRAAAKLPL